jgi:hypothetical protein
MAFTWWERLLAAIYGCSTVLLQYSRLKAAPTNLHSFRRGSIFNPGLSGLGLNGIK